MEGTTEADIRFNCGCVFRTSSYDEALSHAKTYGHTLSIYGAVRFVPTHRQMPVKIRVPGGRDES